MRASIKPGVIFPETTDEKNLPSELIFDIIDGKPYRYKAKHSALQHLVISNYLLRTLLDGLHDERNLMIASGPGLYINERDVVTSDIMIFERSKLTIDENYAQVPPKITLDLDVKAELGDMTEDEYAFLKASKLVNFGVAKVIWIFTKSEKVLVVNNQSWTSSEWNSEVIMLPGISFNIGQYLCDEGSKYA
jgi:hypothetical protein